MHPFKSVLYVATEKINELRSIAVPQIGNVLVKPLFLVIPSSSAVIASASMKYCTNV